MRNHHGFDKAHSTLAPAMDVSSPSNYERLIYFVNQQSMEESLRYANDPTHSSYHFQESVMSAVQAEFLAFRYEDEQISECVDKLYTKYQHIIDPHTAIGLLAADDAVASGIKGPIVSVSTASPIKFLDFYTKTSITKEQVLAIEPLPEPLAKPLLVELPNRLDSIKDYLRSIS